MNRTCGGSLRRARRWRGLAAAAALQCIGLDLTVREQASYKQASYEQATWA
ncbi:MAG: hypothetical protein IT536_11560 [Hyphomicrobiales bacterium]|nr:hypothetical protein [Hyphomicrobiales bacterium]